MAFYNTIVRRVPVIILIFTFFAAPSYSDQTERLGKIVVTPSRLTADYQGSARSLSILTDSDMTRSPYVVISDVIAGLGNIDIRRRGPEGVQADINIRGSNFDENTVLLDGIKINDPQTGHYTMDIPVTAADIDRVEILKGPASSLYGPNSFGGVINIITKRPEKAQLAISSSGGSFDYFDTLLSASFPSGPLANRFSIEESCSSGYMPETEFNIFSLSDGASLKTDFGVYDFFFGYTKKDYGASSFYSNLFPNEEEHTDTRFFKLSGDAEFGRLEIKPNLFLRRHWDKFILDRNRPGWQTNYHTNYSYGGELNFILRNDFMDTAYGFELSRDTIDSTNLQKHDRTKDGMYLELSPHLSEKLNLKIGLREDRFSDFGWEFSPSVNASYEVSKQVSLRALIGRSYRVPTFTDLYYVDSANIGNPALKPESSWTYEAGADCRIGPVNYSLTVFRRDSYDTIDWTRPNTNSSWQASNIGSVNTNGLEASLDLAPVRLFDECTISKTFFSYTALDSYRKHDYLSKYILDYLKHQITCGVDCDILGFRNSWVVNYKKRVGDTGFIVADTKISKYVIKRASLIFDTFMSFTNIFNVNYSEQSGVRMPGREIKAGAKLIF